MYNCLVKMQYLIDSLVFVEVVVVPKGDIMGWYPRGVKHSLCS